MPFVYPSTELVEADHLMAQLGSVWSDDYDNREFIESLTKAYSVEAQQEANDTKEAQLCLARQTIPVYHKEEFCVWELLSSSITTEDSGFSTQLPTGVRAVPLIMDRITDPTISWSNGTDYTVVDDIITFRHSPFATLDSTPVFLAGAVSDYKLTLCLFRPSYDTNYLYDHLGYILGMQTVSTEAHKQLLNVIADAVVGGSSKNDIERIISAFYDIPLTKIEGEIVEELAETTNNKWVITDKNVYKHHKDVTIDVVVGQTLGLGQTQSNAYRWVWPSKSIPIDVDSLIMTPAMLGEGFVGNIEAENTTYTPIVGGVPGSEYVEFPLVGDTADLSLFWNTIAAKGEALGYSFYSTLLASGGIPAVINPMIFLLQNVFRHNAVAVYINTDYCGPSAIANPALSDVLSLVLPARVLAFVTEHSALL